MATDDQSNLMHRSALVVYLLLETTISKSVLDLTRHIRLSFLKLPMRTRTEKDFFVMPTKNIYPPIQVSTYGWESKWKRALLESHFGQGGGGESLSEMDYISRSKRKMLTGRVPIILQNPLVGQLTIPSMYIFHPLVPPPHLPQSFILSFEDVRQAIEDGLEWLVVVYVCMSQ